MKPGSVVLTGMKGVVGKMEADSSQRCMVLGKEAKESTRKILHTEEKIPQEDGAALK